MHTFPPTIIGYSTHAVHIIFQGGDDLEKFYSDGGFSFINSLVWGKTVLLQYKNHFHRRGTNFVNHVQVKACPYVTVF